MNSYRPPDPLLPGEYGDAIQVLALEGGADSARELIRIFRDCLWRETRFQAIDALASRPDPRGIEFLLRISALEDDPPMAKAAIRALGRSGDALAGRNLRERFRWLVEKEDNSRPERARALPLLPELIRAAGDAAIPGLDRELSSLLEPARARSDVAAASAAALALGLSRTPTAERALISAAGRAAESPRPVALACLQALSKTANDPTPMDSLAQQWRDDPLAFDLALAAAELARARAFARLEDLLEAFLESPSAPRAHAIDPRELNRFAAKDLVAGLALLVPDSAPIERKRRACRILATTAYPELALEVSRLATGASAELLASLADACSRQSEPEWIDACSALPAHPEAKARALTLLGLANPGSTISWEIALGCDTLAALATLGIPGKENAERLRPWLKHPDSWARARALRSCAAVGLGSPDARALAKAALDSEDADLRGSALLYGIERPFPGLGALALAEARRSLEANELARAGLAFRAMGLDPIENPALESLIASALDLGGTLACESLLLVSRLSRVPEPALLDRVRALATTIGPPQLAALLALKSIAGHAPPELRDRIAETLVAPLESKEPAVRGRALDALLSIPGPRALRLAIEHIEAHSSDEEIFAKFLRSFQVPPSPIPELADRLARIQKRHPAHPRADSIARAAESIRRGSAADASSEGQSGDAGHPRDPALRAAVLSFERLSESVKSALRAAEIACAEPATHGPGVDQSASVVEYCKALDLHLEREVGRAVLFPALERRLHEFQGRLHLIGLDVEDLPAPRLSANLGIDWPVAELPAHKIALIARDTLTARILREDFRTLDGLRAWASVLVLFFRSCAGAERPLVKIGDWDSGRVAAAARRLNALQEIRNPAAHRETLTDAGLAARVRAEVFSLIDAFSSALRRP